MLDDDSPIDGDDEAGEGTATSKPDPKALAQRWLAQIDRAKRDLASYWERCDKIQKLYTEARKASTNTEAKRQFSILWANQCVLQPAVYARTPAPVVQRRYRDRDPVARNVCNFQERAIEYNFDRVNIDEILRAVRDDFLLFGRGLAWVRYEPTIEEQPDPTNPEATIEAVTAESVPVDHVNYRDYVHPKVRTWSELPWLARRVFMGKREVEGRFGKDIAKAIAYEHKVEGESEDSAPSDEQKAIIYEVWSKVDNKVCWVSPGHPEALDYAEPHLVLENFWPCPKPAYGTLATNSLIPVPDYIYYMDQAEEIDDLTQRIAALVDSLKLVGFYPSGPSQDGAEAIEIAIKAGTENTLIPIPSWAAWSEKGGVAQIQWLPVDQVVKVLQACFETRKQLIEDVYQITGISDIVRGESDPRETAAAQGIKAQWGSIRIRDRQSEMARFARDLTRLMGEIIADKFQPETLMQMTGLSLPTDAEVEAEYQQALQQWQMQARQAMAMQQGAANANVPPAGGGVDAGPGAGMAGPPDAPQMMMGAA